MTGVYTAKFPIAWYKKTIGTNKLQSLPRAGTKRRRPDCSSSRPKRLKAREPHGELFG